MIATLLQPVTRSPAHARSRSGHCLFAVLGLAAVLAGCQTAPSLPLAGNPFAPASTPQLAVGDTYVYQYADGYGNLEGGKVSYRVDSIDGDRIVMSVTPEVRREGEARTEVYTRDGNRVRHPLTSHGHRLDTQYTPAYPAYVFPLEPGKSWSMRVDAADPAGGWRQSILVEGKVLGAERIRVPAGEFDTIKIRRNIYTRDMSAFMNATGNTRISEIDWYAPALGRSVRTESDSRWNVSGSDPWFRTRHGDWNVYELVSAPAPVR